MPFLAIRELAALVLPRGANGGIVMLTAYFDDSGTHDDSEFVLMAGLYGNEAQWAAFDAAWRSKIAAPVPGKPPLKRFHMSHCEAGEGEFSTYSRPERDILIRDLRSIIIENRLHGYCCGVARHDWDALVTGQVRGLLGDAERFCVQNAMLWTVEWAKRNGEESVAFVIDRRPSKSQAANRRVYEFFERYEDVTGEIPGLVGISFLSSEMVTPLQGADLVAWELYQLGLAWLKDGLNAARRPHLKRLTEAKLLDVQFAKAEQIAPMVEFNRNSPLLKQFGSVFEHGLPSLPEFLR